MPTSERKILANRENGAKSKGPVTDEGKRKSSLNALTHGLLAQTAIFPTEASREEFESLLAGLKDTFHPSNFFEELLIGDLAVVEWKLHQCGRQELRHLSNSKRAATAKIAKLMPHTVAMSREGLDWGVPGSWDCDSVLVKLRDVDYLLNSPDHPPEQTAIFVEARLSDPMPKLDRYSRSLRRTRDKILNLLLRLKGLQKTE